MCIMVGGGEQVSSNNGQRGTQEVKLTPTERVVLVDHRRMPAAQQSVVMCNVCVVAKGSAALEWE